MCFVHKENFVLKILKIILQTLHVSVIEDRLWLDSNHQTIYLEEKWQLKVSTCSMKFVSFTIFLPSMQLSLFKQKLILKY